MGDVEQLLTPAEVARMFRVNPKTVSRWAMAGRLGSIRTPGGHRRFRETEVAALLATPTEPDRGTVNEGPGKRSVVVTGPEQQGPCPAGEGGRQGADVGGSAEDDDPPLRGACSAAG